MRRVGTHSWCWGPGAVGTAIVFVAFVVAPTAAESPATRPAQPASLGVGLRRSSYGLPARNADDAWWVARAKAFAAGFPGARPVVVQIVSTYQNDGSTQFG